MKKVIYLVLGAIASGKSNVSQKIITKNSDIEYLCADLYKKTFFNIPVSGENPSKIGYRCADELLFHRIEELCNRGSNFILEFCPTNRNKFETIKYYAKLYGYQIFSYFIGTDDVNINITRNTEREKNGEDHIPLQKVKIRYEDAFNSILEIMCISKFTYFIDNSNEHIRVVALLKNSKIFVFDSNCDWFKKKVIKKIINQKG